MRDKVHQLRQLNRQWLDLDLPLDLMLPFIYLFLYFYLVSL